MSTPPLVEDDPAFQKPVQQGPDAQELASHEHWRSNLTALTLGTFCNTVGFTVVFPFLPLVVRELGVGEAGGLGGSLETWVGWIAGSFFTVSFLLAPVWGAMADYFGRKPMVLRAGLGMAIGFTALASADRLWLFLAIYLLVGVFNGYVPAAVALVATTTPQAHLGKAISTIQAGALVGVTVGPALGAFLAPMLPAYRHLFYVAGAMSLIAGSVALLRVREHHVRPAGPFRLTVLQDARVILRVPRMALLFGINFIFAMTMFGSTTVVALYMLEMAQDPAVLRGLRLEVWVGVATLALTVASTMAVPFWGRLLDRLEPARVLLFALGSGLLSMLPFPFVRGPLQLTAARFLLGLFAVGIQPAAVRLTKDWAPGGMDARTLALGTSLQMLGQGAGPLLAGLIGPAFGLRAYFACNAALIALGLAGWGWRGLRQPPVVA